jgi:AraC-like DNA-binding protein
VKRSHYKYHDYERIPIQFSISAGDRYLADNNYLFRGEHNPYLEFRAVYGNPFDKINDAPYDYFTATATLGLSPNQPLISKINLLGKLWGVPLKTSTGMEMMFGVFQHFNYFDSEEIINGSGRIPYKISEAASVGPGIIYKFPRMNSLVNLEQSVFLSAILLGGSLTGLAGCTLPLDTLPDAAHWRHTHQQLAEAPDDTERLARLFSALRPILHAPRHQANLHACQQLIQALASTPLAATPPMLGLSLRQLQRRSQAMLGLTPKQYQATLLAALRAPRADADMAAEYGFFDQSHMARELRRLAGAPLRELRHAQQLPAQHWPLQVGLRLR